VTAPKAVIFDVDGTLVDSVYFHVVSWFRACHDFNIAVDGATLHGFIGMGADQVTRQLVGHEMPALGEAQGRHMQGFVSEVKPFRGAGDLIRELSHRQLRVAVATSGGGETTNTYLLRVLSDVSIIDSVVTGDDIEASKPAPDVISIALQRSRLTPSSTVMVGDSRWDVEAAARCGVKTIALRSGGRSEGELRDAGAIAVYEDVNDLLLKLTSSPLV
jgi:HAD superfamily hydrolase (TIGR01549 family)